MDSQDTASQVHAGAQAPPQGFVARLTGIYFEPGKTFEDISRKPTWLGIYILLAVLAVGSTYALTTRMDRETYMRKAIEMNPLSRNLPEEQIQAAISRPQGAFEKYSGFVFAPVGILIGYLVFAGIFLLLFTLMGASLTFKKSLAASFWGMGPPSIILTILSIIFMFVKDPQTLEINPAYNVASNLGMLVSSQDNPVIHSILSSIDVFSFWMIFLLAVGFAAISDRKLTTKKAATGLIVLWGIYVLGKAGFHAIFS